MFAMSVKLVPGWSVLIVPMLIGVPVAATPLFVPHVDVSTVPVPLPDDADVAGAPLLEAGALAEELLELELELQPARTPPTARTEASAAASRHLRGAFSFISVCLLVANRER